MRTAIDAHQGRLIRFATRITGDLESARDVVQDTFLRLCRENPDDVADHLAAWLFRVCRNRALDVRKKERPLRPLEGVVSDALPERRPGPEGVLEQSEQSRAMLAALDTLPAPQQEVLRLRFLDELSYKEISAVTGHSVGNVGFLVHTGVKTLRGRLGASPSSARLAVQGDPADA
jgi:RNA polymerase sigma factor (sigma-70 family)